MKRAEKSDIIGSNTDDNATTAIEILRGEQGAKRDIVVYNAGAAIYAAGKASTIAECVTQAQHSIDSGKALDKLNRLIAMTNQF